MKPKISVIIPVYNAEKYLVPALDSVLKQTLAELEIICVNDCSQDKSSDILHEFALRDKRVVVYDNPQNMGVALTRNKGMEIATGEYITFLDNDDSIAPAMYETLYQEAVKGDYDVVKCDISVHSAGRITSPVYENDLWGEGSVLRDKMISLLLYQFKEDGLPTGLWMSGVWNKIYRREFLRDNQILFLSEREFSYEDFLFNLSVLLKTTRLRNINQPLYHYNYHPGSLGGTYSYQSYRNMVNTYQIVEQKLLAENSLEASVTERLYYRICAGITVGALNEWKRNPQGKKGALKEIRYIFMHPLTKKAISRVELKRMVNAAGSGTYRLLAETILRTLQVIHLFT